MLYTDFNGFLSPEYDPRKDEIEFYEAIVDSISDIAYTLDEIKRTIEGKLTVFTAY
ncbi:hypothetical protein AALA61_15740 [Oscillospiraceae bacterium 42-9]